MTSRLDQQIRALLAQVIDETPAAPSLANLDRPREAAEPAVRSLPGWRVGLVTAVAVTIAIGLPALVLLGGEDRAAEDGAALEFQLMPQPPPLDLVEHLWIGSDGTLLVYGGTEAWTSAAGATWTSTGPAPASLSEIDSRDGTFVGTNDAGELFVARDNNGWLRIDLPSSLTPDHSALTLQYAAEDVAIGAAGIVVQGGASTAVNPKAVEEAFPELGTVTRVSRVAPCGPDGEPVACDLDSDDALWVWTADDEEPQSVSLSAMGLTKADIWRAHRVIWFSDDGTVFETIEHPGASESGSSSDTHGLIATIDGFAMIDGGGLWTSTDGRSWTHHSPPLDDISDLFTSGSRMLGMTNLDQVTELHPDGSRTVIADPAKLRSAEFDDVRVVAAGELGLVAVGYRNMILPDIEEEEPLETAQAIWFSTDGRSWSRHYLDDSFGTFGALEIVVTDDVVIVVFGAEQAEDLQRIVEPQWWAGTAEE